MQLETKDNRVKISGNMKSVMDYKELKTLLDTLSQEYKTITLDVVDSISITSSIIGYLNKLVLKDKITLTMHVGNALLFELLDELSLVELFNVKKA